MDLLNAVTSAISSVITWVSTVINALIDSSDGALYALLPLFAIGIAISAVLLGKIMLRVNFSNSVKLLFKTIPSEAYGNV